MINPGDAGIGESCRWPMPLIWIAPSIAAANCAYRVWRGTPAEERGQVLKRAANLMRERR